MSASTWQMIPVPMALEAEVQNRIRVARTLFPGLPETEIRVAFVLYERLTALHKDDNKITAADVKDIRAAAVQAASERGLDPSKLALTVDMIREMCKMWN
jgi:hypothetical protein